MSSVSKGLVETLGSDGLSWWDFANCLGADYDTFFPERGASAKKAKAICGKCLVRMECLDDAVTRGEKFGIRGGMTERERRDVRRSKAVAKAAAGARLK